MRGARRRAQPRCAAVVLVADKVSSVTGREARLNRAVSGEARVLPRDLRRAKPAGAKSEGFLHTPYHRWLWPRSTVRAVAGVLPAESLRRRRARVMKQSNHQSTCMGERSVSTKFYPQGKALALESCHLIHAANQRAGRAPHSFSLTLRKPHDKDLHLLHHPALYHDHDAPRRNGTGTLRLRLLLLERRLRASVHSIRQQHAKYMREQKP